MCILVLAVEVSGDQLSPINVVGLVVCLMGITGHILHKVLVIKRVAGTVRVLEDDDFVTISRTRVLALKDERSEPLLNEQKWQEASDESDNDSNLIIYEIMQRRDGS